MATLVYKIKPEYYTVFYKTYLQGFLAEQKENFLDEGAYWGFTDSLERYYLDLFAKRIYGSDVVLEDVELAMRDKYFYALNISDFLHVDSSDDHGSTLVGFLNSLKEHGVDIDEPSVFTVE